MKSGFIPSPYIAKFDSFQRQPTWNTATGKQERVDLAALPRANDSNFRIPDTRRQYECILPFNRVGIWWLARAVAQARAVYLHFQRLLHAYANGDCSYVALPLTLL